MRRFVVFTVLACLFLGLASPSQASQPKRFVYDAHGFYTFWRDQRPISADAYLKINWYASASSSREGQDDGFWSSVYRYQYRCERREEGRDRCHLRSRMGGRERDLSDVTFWVDPDLDTAGLAGSYRLRQVKDHEVVAVRNIDISVELRGRGEVYRSMSSYTNWDGTCPESRYRFQERYHRAYASVTMTGDFRASRTRIKGASMYEYEGFVLRRKCD